MYSFTKDMRNDLHSYGRIKKVQVGKTQETAQSERNSLS